ncbi:hypothetical protein MHYP_G00091750 [Metynnis hypsauchen]
MPQQVANTKEKVLFYNQLDTVLGAVRRHDMCLLLGDFNARVGSDRRAFPEVLGPHGVGEANDNGQRLLSTCNTHGMCIGGTLFQHKFIHKYTWTSNTPSKVRAQLDHIIINKRWKRSLQDCRTFRGADISSDHELLIGVVKMKLARPKHGGQSRRFAIYKLNDPLIKATFEKEVTEELSGDREVRGVEEDWQSISDGLIRAAECTLGPHKTKRKDWISTTTEELVEQRRKVKIKRDLVGMRQSSEEYRALDKKVKKSVCKDKQQWFDECAEELEGTAKQNNHRKMYQLVKKMAGKRTPQPIVHRPSLWKILHEYCVPEKIINIIRNAYKGCEARVRVGGELTDWFCIETGVRQGCVWSPILFGVLIDWLLRKACDGYGIQLEKSIRTLRGFREGWKLPDLDFADDVALITSGDQKATEALSRLRRAGEEVGLVVSTEKTKVMPVGQTEINVEDEGHPINKVETFCYLGSNVTVENTIDEEINIRIGRAASAFQNLRNTWKAKIRLSTKLRIYNAVVLTTLLYGAETWAMTKQLEQRIDAFDTRCLRSILNVRWWHHIRNTEVRERTQQPYASLIVKKNRLQWFGHVKRMDPQRLPYKLYFWDPSSIGSKRRQGRQRQRWIDTCSRDLRSIGLTLQEGVNIAKNREEWKFTLSALM